MNDGNDMAVASRRTRKAVLLAGGLGTRLRPITNNLPKCLVRIADRPILDYWIDTIHAAGIREILINTHHFREQVVWYIAETNARRQVRLVESYEPELLGSAGTIHANRDWVDDGDDCVIIYADNLSNVNLRLVFEFHALHDDPFTMMLFHTERPHECGIAELDSENRVVSFIEKPRDPRSDLANAGLYVVSADGYREMADIDGFDIGFDIIPRFVGRMRGWVFDGYHRDIGNLDALERAERDAPQVFGLKVDRA